jgi:hypothetical protein
LLSGTSLQLDAFARGTLYLYVVVPTSQAPGQGTVAISLASSRGPRAAFNGTVDVVAPDLTVRIDATPAGTADPVLVGDINITVLCSGPRAVANATVEVWVDGARAFEAPVGPLCPPGSAAFTVTISLGPGNHTVEALVDPAGTAGGRGSVAESDEGNNRAQAAFELAAAPAPPDDTPPDGQEPAPVAGVNLSLLVVLLSAAAGAAVAVFGLMRSRRARREEPAAATGDENELL